MQGGQLSKDFFYDSSVEKQAEIVIVKFSAFYALIKFRFERVTKPLIKYQ